jgi:hypothetical protein
MVVVAMKVCLIDVKFDTNMDGDMHECLRVRGSNFLYTLLFVNGRAWSYHNLKTMGRDRRWTALPATAFRDVWYEADVVFQATANELLMLQLEGKYNIEDSNDD